MNFNLLHEIHSGAMEIIKQYDITVIPHQIRRSQSNCKKIDAPLNHLGNSKTGQNEPEYFDDQHLKHQSNSEPAAKENFTYHNEETNVAQFLPDHNLPSKGVCA